MSLQTLERNSAIAIPEPAPLQETAGTRVVREPSVYVFPGAGRYLGRLMLALKIEQPSGGSLVQTTPVNLGEVAGYYPFGYGAVHVTYEGDGLECSPILRSDQIPPGVRIIR